MLILPENMLVLPVAPLSSADPGLTEDMLDYSARCLREFFGLGF
jgi:hypothetical protein